MNLDQQNIIAQLGLQNLPDDRKLAILNKMTDLLEKRLMVRVLGVLSEDQQNTFADILEKNQPDEVQKFIADNCPDFANWLTEETNKLKTELGQIQQPA